MPLGGTAAGGAAPLWLRLRKPTSVPPRQAADRMARCSRALVARRAPERAAAGCGEAAASGAERRGAAARAAAAPADPALQHWIGLTSPACLCRLGARLACLREGWRAVGFVVAGGSRLDWVPGCLVVEIMA